MSLLTAEEFISRKDQNALPLDGQGEIDLVKVNQALDEASGIIRGYLPFLVDDEGAEVTPPAKLLPALQSIEADIAFYRLTDRVSSTEDDRNHYKDAVSLLEKFSKQEQKGLEGPGEQEASLVEADSEGVDPRFFKKGFMV